MTIKWRRNHNAAFKAKVSLKAVCSGFTIIELAPSYRCISARWRIGKDWSIHRNYISQLELGSKSPPEPANHLQVVQGVREQPSSHD